MDTLKLHYRHTRVQTFCVLGHVIRVEAVTVRDLAGNVRSHYVVDQSGKPTIEGKLGYVRSELLARHGTERGAAMWAAFVLALPPKRGEQLDGTLPYDWATERDHERDEVFSPTSAYPHDN